MKQIILLFSAVLALLFTACSSDDVNISTSVVSKQELTDAELTNVINSLYSKKDVVTDQMVEAALEKYINIDDKVKKTPILTRSFSSATLPKDAMPVLESIESLNPEDYSTAEDYYSTIRTVVIENRSRLSESSYNAMLASVNIALKVTNSYLEEKANQEGLNVYTRAYRHHHPATQVSWWKAWGKCAVAICGGTLGGGLGGAVAGSAVPGLGTTAGAIIGAIGGGMSSAAAAC
nr:hypothetical protein [uncultured Prevotella sp.]